MTSKTCQICNDLEFVYTCKKCEITFCFKCASNITDHKKHISNIPLCPKCKQPIEKAN